MAEFRSAFYIFFCQLYQGFKSMYHQHPEKQQECNNLSSWYLKLKTCLSCSCCQKLLKQKSLLNYLPYLSSCLTCLHASRALILTCFNYAFSAPYLLFAMLYIHIHVKANYAINRIYEKTFRSDLSTQKNLSFDELLTTSYFLLLFVRTW